MLGASRTSSVKWRKDGVKFVMRYTRTVVPHSNQDVPALSNNGHLDLGTTRRILDSIPNQVLEYLQHFSAI